MKRIVLAMSGGVDSSVAAVLLKEQGHDLIGCTMQLWDARRNPEAVGRPPVGRCCSLDDAYDARRVAEHLGFPFYLLNFEAAFEQKVIVPFISDYLCGRTPIPCALCNTHLKFDKLVSFAQKVGFDKVATGHYARVSRSPLGELWLLKGRDLRKDQSYFLFELTQAQLSAVEFPLGEYAKEEIRKVAENLGLPTARKPESQEICFVPDGDYAGFIERNGGSINGGFLPILQRLEQPGPIFFKDGTRLGSHGGIHRYTIGQRRGLGIAHPQPLYVIRLEPGGNAVIVGYRSDAYSRGLLAERVNWIAGPAPENSVPARVRVRSNHRESPACVRVYRDPGTGTLGAEVIFDSLQLAVTPGQAAVFYEGERVLGGGWIAGRIA